MTGDERVYRLLLRFYPKAFRSEYEDQLLEVFRYRRAEAQTAGGWLWRLGFWRAIGHDVLESAGPDRRSRTMDEQRGGGGMGLVWQDLRQAGRRLLRSPGFTAAAVVILCAGIGVNVAAFSVVNALLFQPPPFEEPDRLAELLQDSDGGEPSSTSYPAFQDIREHDALFEAVAARAGGAGTLQLDDALVPISTEFATASYLEVLGLSPTRGRWFQESEDVLEGPPVAVVSYQMWNSRLGMDPDILGRLLRIDGTNVTVVGVGPERYSGGFGPAVGDLWLSISAMDDVGGPARSLERRQDHPFRVIARLRAGVQLGDVVTGMDRLSSRLAREFPEVNRNRRIHVLPVAAVGAEQQGRLIPGALLVMGVVGLVLLVATINLTNLLLVRSAARRREIAVRLALGGSRIRLVRVLLSETILLTAVGGATGFVLAQLGLDYLRGAQLNFGVPLTLDVRMDVRVFAFALVISGATVLLAGLLPALRSTGSSTAAGLNDRIGGSLRRKHGVTGILVATQMAASLLLLFTAGLFVQSLVKARVADPGFNTDGLALVRTDLRQLDLSADGLRTTYADLEERIEALPGVLEVTTSFQAPVSQRGTTTLLVNDDADGGLKPVEIPWNLVGNDYFATLGVPLLHGRLFGDRDGPSEPTRIVVNEAMARAFWGRTDVVGEFIASESDPEEPSEVIGVVGNTKVASLGEGDRAALYWSLSQAATPALHLLIRSRQDAGAVLAPVREVIRRLDPRIPVLRATTMEAHLGETLARQSFTARFLTGVGVVGWLLAAYGMYALVSFGVSQRRREVGLRMALGAERPSILSLFVREVGRIAFAGALGGIVLSLLVGRALGAGLVSGEGQLPVLGLSVTGLLGAALIATLIPALRAARLDPMTTLRLD